MFELLTNTEMASADHLTIAGGMPGTELMERAGRAVADAVAARHAVRQRVVIVAGPGNNGGDGFVAARVLAGRGYHVRVLLAGEMDRLKGDAALAAKAWNGEVAPAEQDGFEDADVVVDALFGAGLDRPIGGPARGLID